MNEDNMDARIEALRDLMNEHWERISDKTFAEISVYLLHDEHALFTAGESIDAVVSNAIVNDGDSEKKNSTVLSLLVGLCAIAFDMGRESVIQ